MVIIMLPMFGDYYTATLFSGSPKTNMVGKLIEQNINASAGGSRAPPYHRADGVRGLLMTYYLFSVARATREAGRERDAPDAPADVVVEPLGPAALPGNLSPGLTSSGRSSPWPSPCCSASTTAARAAPGRASRSAGISRTQTSPSARPVAARRARAEPEARRR